MREGTLKFAESMGYKVEKEMNVMVGALTHLVKGNHRILVSSIVCDERYYKPDAEIIREIKRGKIDYEAEYEKMWNGL